ncbi:MAG: sensor histidine kinase, partial [Acetobacterium sp.]|nr:sensor histidine kinase [Acetobacterium sp.]
FIDTNNIFVDVNTAIPLGLVINELVSNSLQHAFPGGRTGQITISIHDDQKGLTLTYQDNGIGFSEGFDLQTTDSVGFRLIRMLIDQLDGTIVQEPCKGTYFSIRVMKKTDEQGRLHGTFNPVPE